VTARSDREIADFRVEKEMTVSRPQVFSDAADVP
jgi:hypothetical protein